MSRTAKLGIALLVLIVLGAIVSHGVVIPRFIWGPQLAKLQAKHPGIQVDAKRLVVALNLHPKIMVSDLSVQSDRFKESANIGLASFSIDALASIKAGKWVADALNLKEIDFQRHSKADCATEPRQCIPRSPFAALGLALKFSNGQSHHLVKQLPKIHIENARLNLNAPGQADSMVLFVDRFNLVLPNSTQTGTAQPNGQLNTALRLLGPTPEKSMYLTLQAQPVYLPGEKQSSLLLNAVQLDTKGSWQGFPWSGQLNVDSLKAFGYPILHLEGEGLKSYLRRNDSPDTHQAAFAAKSFTGGLLNQPWEVKNATWTTTTDKAKAWSFNLSYEPRHAMITIEPASIAGLEAEPAQAQVRTLDCNNPHLTLRQDKPIWAWSGQWFKVYGHLNEAKGDPLVICPVQDAPGLAPSSVG